MKIYLLARGLYALKRNPGGQVRVEPVAWVKLITYKVRSLEPSGRKTKLRKTCANWYVQSNRRDDEQTPGTPSME